MWVKGDLVSGNRFPSALFHQLADFNPHRFDIILGVRSIHGFYEGRSVGIMKFHLGRICTWISTTIDNPGVEISLEFGEVSQLQVLVGTCRVKACQLDFIDVFGSCELTAISSSAASWTGIFQIFQ